MRVLYYSDALAKRQRFGLGRYAHELAGALARVAPDVELLPAAARVEGAVPDGLHVVRGGRRVLAAAWARIDAPAVERLAPPFDVLHTVEMAYPVASRRPRVATLHDLGPLTHPEWFSDARMPLKRRALAQAARAAAVVCVSEATADALVGLIGEAVRGRVHVIPEGVSPFFARPPAADDLRELRRRTPRGLPPDGTPYLLWTGSKLSPRKNLATTLDAFERAAREVPHHLVLAGGVGWDAEPSLRRIRASPVRDRIHRPGYVTDAELRALYAGAAAFLYVSRLEGFGLPILEAMAAGAPVVTSSVSSMPEVSGDAARLADPLDADAIAEAVVAIATDPAEAGRLRAAGRARAARFTWESAAERTAAVYRLIAP